MASQDSILEPQTPTTFPKFPKLPLELRDEVMSYHLPEPRFVEIVQRNIPAAGTQPVASHAALLQSSIGIFNTPPLLLSVNRESRALVKRKYRLAFESVLVHPVYINFEIDVLACLSMPVWTTFMAIAQMTGEAPIEFDPIKNLALPAPTPTYKARALVGMAIQVARDFPGLRKLLVVEPRMYWAQVTPTPVNPLDQQELRDLLTLHRQIAFCGVYRGEHWEASEAEIVPEGALRSRYPDHLVRQRSKLMELRLIVSSLEMPQSDTREIERQLGGRREVSGKGISRIPRNTRNAYFDNGTKL
ncbi:hypothetical protein DL98DRAFT_532938 [Cadophora sp. DSE1049]|nr:hypothetical protein DL98DRAFT_532938 [Cadophora sp. DSE1049]